MFKKGSTNKLADVETSSSSKSSEETCSLEAKLTKRLVWLSFVGSLSCFNTGYNLGIINMIESLRHCQPIDPNDTQLIDCIDADDVSWGLMAGCIALGAILGSLLSGKLSFKLGIKNVFYLQASIFIISGILLSTSHSVAQFCVGRFIAGIGCGLATCTTPAYLGEIAPPKTRGLLGSLTSIMLSFGIAFASMIALLNPTYLSWRVLLALTSGIGLVQLITLTTLIETPRNLLLIQNKPDKARYNLQLLRSGYDIQEEFRQMSIIDPSETPNSMVTRMKKLKNDTPKFKLSILVILLVTFQEFSGISAILYYSILILEETISEEYIKIGAMSITLVSLLAAILSSTLVDLAGRRKLLMLGSGFQILSGTGIALGAIYGQGVLQIVSLMGFVFFFNIGILSISYILLPELVPTIYLDFISGISLTCSWTFSFLVSFLFPTILSALGGYSFFIFVGTNVIIFYVVTFHVPETSRMTLDHIHADEFN